MSRSESNLAFRRSNPSAASLYASTMSPPSSRSMSPVGRGSPSRTASSTIPGTVFDMPPSRGFADNGANKPGEPLNLILQSFVPHVAVYASKDTEVLIGEKGCTDGLWGLLRPFGENIQGKVSVRDSNGASRAVEDFSVRFTQLGDNIGHPDPSVSGFKLNSSPQDQNGAQESSFKDRKFKLPKWIKRGSKKGRMADHDV